MLHPNIRLLRKKLPEMFSSSARTMTMRWPECDQKLSTAPNHHTAQELLGNSGSKATKKMASSVDDDLFLEHPRC
jgi:hypothetical protein